MTIDARGLLEGTTPDEWRPNSIAIVIGEDKNLAIFSPDMRVLSAISMARMVANARLAAAAPALARDNIAKDAIIEAQSATIERLNAEVERMGEAITAWLDYLAVDAEGDGEKEDQLLDNLRVAAALATKGGVSDGSEARD